MIRYRVHDQSISKDVADSRAAETRSCWGYYNVRSKQPGYAVRDLNRYVYGKVGKNGV